MAARALLCLPLLALAAPVPAQAQAPAPARCAPPAQATARTTLYFGLSRPRGGVVSGRDWKRFLRDEITPRFPQGLSVVDARGQWRGADGRIARERSKMVLILHPDTPEASEAVRAIIAVYRQRFEQEAVLREDAEVCAAF